MESNVRVLIIDDDPDFADALAESIESHVHSVTTVYAPHQALQVFQKDIYDLVFIDVRMPEISGVELMKKMRDHRHTSKFVIMTGYAVGSVLKDATRHGAHEILNKPLQQDIVFKILTQAAPAGVVLVVDDDTDFAESIKEILELKDYRVAISHTGEHALELINNNGFSAVLLDIRLPSMDGLQVYQNLRLHNPALPIILITAYGIDVDQELNNFLADLNDERMIYAKKPIETSTLLKHIQNISPY